MDNIVKLEQAAKEMAKKNDYSDEAIAINKKILEHNLRNTGAINRLARCYEMNADYKTAIACFGLAIKVDPKNQVANSRKKKLEKRIKIAKDVEAVYKGSTYEELMVIAGQSKEKGDYDFAIGVVEKAIGIKRTTPALTRLASLYRRVHELERAESLYMSILKTDSDNEAALVGCAAVYRDMEFLGRAREMYEMVLRNNPNNSFALKGLGAVLFDIGLDEDSVRKFCRAHDIGDIQTYDEDVLSKIRDRYIIEGNKEGAERINCILRKKPLR